MNSIWDGPVFFLVLASIGIGWLIGSMRIQQYLSWPKRIKKKSPKANVVSFLLENQSTKAVEWIDKLEVNADTIETHLSLGALFRKRGETEKALRIHQNLLIQSNLSRHHQENARLELAQDYFAAGLVDRAERLLLDLVEVGGKYRRDALAFLCKIYEQLKDWQRASEVGEQLLKAGDAYAIIMLEHYACEQAEQRIKQGDFSGARSFVRRANQFDRRSIRASLILARIALQEDQFEEVLSIADRIQQHHWIWVGTILPTYLDSCLRLNQPSRYKEFLLRVLEQGMLPEAALALAVEIEKSEGVAAAANFLGKSLTEQVSMRLITHWMHYVIQQPEHAFSSLLPILKHLELWCASVISHAPLYRCDSCGYSASETFWQCTQCQQWGQVNPIHQVAERGV